MSWDTGAPNTSLLTTYLIKKFIPALESELQYQRFTTKASIPGGMGVTARWNLFNSPAANTTALTEGTTTGNEITTLTTTGTEATIAEYGEFIRTNRLMEYAQVSGSRSELVDRMSYGGALSLDSLVRAQALTTTTAAYAQDEVYGATATATAGADPVDQGSASALIYCAAQLHGNSARGFRGVNGHKDGHFAAILTPTTEQDMVQEATAGRMTWAEANTDVPGSMGQEKWVNGFMGSVYGTACYRTQNFSLTTITISLENNYVLADSGLGALSIIDADPTILINTPSSGDVGNPYRNRSTIAWHSYFATALLDSNRVVRLYTEA